MEKRFIIAIVLCAGVLFAWQTLFPPPKPAAPPPAPPVAASPAPSAPSTAGAPAPSAAGAPTTPAAGAPSVARPEREVELVTPAVRFVLSNRGGTLRHAQLREQKFLMRKGDPSSGLDIVRTIDPAHA